MKIHLYSLHGLFRAHKPEIGRDADNGGQIIYVMELGRQLARDPRVSEVTLVTRLIADPELDPIYAQAEERVSEKFVIRRIPFGGNAYQLKENLWPHLDEFVRNARDWMHASGNGPDVIHGHYADAGYAGVRVAAELGEPFVQTGHSLGRPKLARLLADGMAEAEAMKRFRFAERFAAENATLERAAFVVTSSRQEISTYQDYPAFRHARFEVIPPGTDLGRFVPYYTPPDEARMQARLAVEASLGRFLRDPRKPLILAVCRADRKKNVESLVEAYGRDRALQAIANLAVVVGLREDIATLPQTQREVFDRLLLLQDRYNLYGRLALPKQHDPAVDVPELYRLAAERRGVFVNVALTEPFGLTLLEAAACGLPLVATNDGGPAEIVPACESGKLVEPTNMPQIQQALLEMLTDEQAWLRCSHAGIRNVRLKYGWEAHMARYLDLVSEVVREKGGRA